MDYQPMIDIIETYAKTNPTTIKNNIYDIISMFDLEKQDVADIWNIDKNKLNNLLNIAQASKPSLVQLIKLSENTGVEVEFFFRENNTIRGDVKWDSHKKVDFLIDYEDMSIEEVCTKYNLSEKSVELYRKKFQNECCN